MRGISEKDLREKFRNLYWSTDNERQLLTALLTECKELNPWLPISDAPKDRPVLLYKKGTPYSTQFIGHANANWMWQPTHYQELPVDPKE